jgi:acyl-CoA synthetase (AMP-forming)/AMP-acid ligase II
MLYERWTELAADSRNETALRDFASGKRWTFSELFSEGEKYGAGGEIIFPKNHSPEFIFQLLAAWRENKIVCPLEPGQSPPQISGAPKNCAHFKITSATTGSSRLVAFTAGQLAADAENIVATMGLRADWPNLGVISPAHSYGFSNLILPLLLHGVPLVLAPAPLPEIVRRAAEAEKFLTLAAVPAMWRAWHEADAIPKNVKLAISAGAPLPLKLETDIFEARGLKIHNFLGASECGGIAFDAAEIPRADAALAGTPVKNVNVSVGKDDCLRVQSRAVGETYWPEKSDLLGIGIFQSGDLVELKNGEVFLRGRLGDLINVAGRKISPETVEGALLANPKVRECLVFGAPSCDERTEIIVAIVVSDAKENELKQFLLQVLPAWQLPREWKFVDSLSANSRGKISRSDWRARFIEKKTDCV